VNKLIAETGEKIGILKRVCASVEDWLLKKMKNKIVPLETWFTINGLG